MDKYHSANRTLWDQWTELHEQSEFYDVQGFKAGRSTLRTIERQELTDVAGKRLLHLQCHFGLDTLSWARQGASVTGVDISEQSIALARSLSRELSIPARFICAPLEQLPDVLDGQFDIVFTSYGVLHWLPDLGRWAEVIAHFLAPGGIFYIVEDHPFMRVFDTDSQGELKVDNPYFFAPEPYHFETRGSYAALPGEDTPIVKGYMWDHSLGEVLNSLIGAGLRIEYLHEFPFHFRAKFAGMQQDADGHWRLTRQHGMLPLLFSLRASRPHAR